ncbi:MAG: hypothetical protein IJ236_05180 [Oscillospiraceae bacterium]|nr:hypothetical protein [Oscillospiraceae bacterium]MBR1899332.1 hypothetical protein [Oscillospiraceae bacterium]
MYEIKFRMTDYSPLKKAVYDRDARYREAVDLLKSGQNYIPWNVTEAFLMNFLEHFSDLRAFGCDGEVRLNKPFKIRRYGWNGFFEAWNPDLFDTYYDSNAHENRIKGIKGLVGTLHGVTEYQGREFDVTLEIRSRFDDVDKPYFLWTMLSEVLTGVPEISSRNTVRCSAEARIDVMAALTVLMFRKALNEAWKSGIYRTYVRREYNDEKLRGAIDLARHIKLNIGQNNACIAYHTRERTEKEPLNQLILHAWAHIRREYPDAVELMGSLASEEQASFQSAIDSIRARVGSSLPDVRSCMGENQREISSPFYRKYEDLRKLCLDILRDDARGTLFSYGSGEQVSGLLFYIPDLWERFLENRIGQRLLSTGIRYGAQVQQYYYGREEDGETFYGMQSRPDYVFCKDGRPVFILDAKFKKFRPFYFYSGKHTGILNGETAAQKAVRQKIYAPWEAAPAKAEDEASSGDLDKVLRDMLVFGAHAGGVIYPVSSEISKELLRELKNRLSAEAEDAGFLREYSGDDGRLKKLFEEIQSAGTAEEDLPGVPHRISEYTPDVFYSFPVKIPSAANRAIREWKTAFDEQLDRAMDALAETLEQC